MQVTVGMISGGQAAVPHMLAYIAFYHQDRIKKSLDGTKGSFFEFHPNQTEGLKERLESESAPIRP